MKKLFFFTGRADSPFIENEIEVLKEFFDDICIVTFPVGRNLFQKTVSNQGVRGYIISPWKIPVTCIGDYIKWLSLKHVRSEIKKNTSLSVKGIKRFFYILYYGLSVINAYRVLDEEIRNGTQGCEVYLYAFWMTRPAYIAASFKWTYKEKIAKVITRAHRYDLYEGCNSTNYLPFRQFISANMDEIHFISENGKNYYTKKTCTKYHITKTPNLFIDYLGTYNTYALKKVIKDKEKVTIASCSYASQVKRLDLIIEFLSAMKGMSVKWIHIGDGKLLNETKALAKDKLPFLKIHFYGNVKNEKILSIYNQEDVDFFINMSDSEGLPVSIMEAMSVGIPVIARNVGGMSEIVNNQNGCLLEGTGDEEKERVRQFVAMRLESIPTYRTFSENAVKTWEDKFNAETNYRKFCKEITEGS